MQRSFEELGVTIDGVSYGYFSGEAQFDVAGKVEQIDLERQDIEGPRLSLDIESLVRERIQLRRKLGTGFLEAGTPEAISHNRRYVLFQALAQTIEASFADDIRDYVTEVASEPDRWTA